MTGVQPNVLWKFNDNHINTNDARIDTNGDGTTLTINSFRSSDEGYYSCVVTTKYWNVSSVHLHVKAAGVYVHYYYYAYASPCIVCMLVCIVVWYGDY